MSTERIHCAVWIAPSSSYIAASFDRLDLNSTSFTRSASWINASVAFRLRSSYVRPPFPESIFVITLSPVTLISIPSSQESTIRPNPEHVKHFCVLFFGLRLSADSATLASMTEDTLIRELERRKAKLGTWKAVAEDLKVTQQYVHDVKEKRRKPGPQFLQAMGLVKVVEYRKAAPEAPENDAA